LLEFDGETVADFDPAVCVPLDEPSLTVCAESLRYTCGKLFGCGTSEKAFIQAYRDTARVVGFLHDRKGGKRRFFARLERLLHIGPALSSLIWALRADEWDYMKLAGKKWHSPTKPEVERNDSFLQLYDAALQKARELIADFLHCANSGTTVQITDKASFDSGKIYKK